MPHSVADAPKMPANLAANGTNRELTLSWNKSSSSEYIEEYDIDLVGPGGYFRYYWAPSTAERIVIRGLSVSTLYRVALTAKNACGWSSFSQLSIQLNADGEVSIDNRAI